jgi:hypothetical protein
VLEIPKKQAIQVLGSFVVNTSEDTFSDAWISRSPWPNSIAETTVGFVLQHLASKMAEIAFLCSELQEKQAIQVFGLLMVNTSKERFSGAWISRSPQRNAMAETNIGFVLRHPASKLAEIAFACWKFQEKQGFHQVLGSLMVNTSKETFSDAWISNAS